jgi:hypothetical protein
MLLTCLLLTNRLLGVDLPGNIRRRIRDLSKVKLLAARLGEDLFREGEGPPVLRQYLWQFDCMDCLRDRIRYCVPLVMMPRGAARATTPPPSFHWLFYLTRPIRLVGKHLLNPIRGYRLLRELAQHLCSWGSGSIPFRGIRSLLLK